MLLLLITCSRLEQKNFLDPVHCFSVTFKEITVLEGDGRLVFFLSCWNVRAKGALHDFFSTEVKCKDPRNKLLR